MSPINSRSKGKRNELALAKVLAPFYPECGRNLDQFGADKRDLLNVADLHIQCKAVERLNIWAALNQAITEAKDTDLPIVAFRRNRTPWYAALELDELLPLLKLRES